jgi:hypothetical protein
VPNFDALKLLKYNRIPQFNPASGRKIGGQLERSVAHANESADGVPERLEQAPNLAISPLFQDHAIPPVRPFALAIAPHALEPRGDPVERDALEQLSFLIRLQSPADPDDVFALKPISWVHEAIRQLAGVGQQQKAGAVEVQPPHCNPSARRQLLEDRGAPLRVASRNEFTDRLVVEEDPGLESLWPDNRFAIHQDRVPGRRAVAELGDFPVYRNPPGRDPGLDFTPRPEAGGGEHLLDSLE